MNRHEKINSREGIQNMEKCSEQTVTMSGFDCSIQKILQRLSRVELQQLARQPKGEIAHLNDPLNPLVQQNLDIADVYEENARLSAQIQNFKNQLEEQKQKIVDTNQQKDDNSDKTE